MKIGVLSSPNSWYWHDLTRAAKDDDELHLLSFTTLAASIDSRQKFASREMESLQSLDALLVRTMPAGSLEQVVFRMNALHRLSQQGVRIMNSPRCLEMAIDKYLASAELQSAGLRVPETRVCQTWDGAMQSFFDLQQDVVVKPLFGGEGRGILRVNDEAMAYRVFKTYEQLGHVIYQQQFITHPGYDLRVLILGDELFGMKRVNDGDWRTNVSRGAQTLPFQVDDELAEISLRAAEAVGTRFAGVDVLPNMEGERFVLEVNAVPGWRALSRTLNVDIAGKVLRLMRTNEGGPSSMPAPDGFQPAQ